MSEKYLALHHQSRFDELVQCLQDDLKTVRDRETGANLLSSLGELHALRREWAEAAQAYGAAINNGLPAPGAVFIRLIEVLLRGGFFDAVLSVSAAPISGSPDANADIAVRKARALWGLNRPDEARACIDSALETCPAHPFALLMRALFAPQPTGGPRLVDMLARPEECRALRDRDVWEWPAAWLSAEYTRGIYPFLYGTEYEDAGFVIVSQSGEPLLRCDVWRAAGRMGGFGFPIRLRPAKGAPDLTAAAGMAVDHLRSLQRVSPVPIQIAELPGTDGRLSAIGRACMKHGGAPQSLVLMDLDLTRPEADLWRGVRKSYRPLIRRGERSLSTRLAAPGTDLFEEYRRLHYVHFPAPAADLVFLTVPFLRALAAEGRMELAIATLDDRPVAANITIDEAGASTYYSARYVRDCGFDVGPFAVWQSILRAKRRGQTRFHLGVYDHEEFTNPKMRDIAFFKAGFTDDFRYEPLWLLQPPAPPKS